ncbi:hypothetical protein D3C76_1798270 [compost metagenome]
MGNARFEAKAAAIISEMPKLDALLANVRATPRTHTEDEIAAMSAEATVLLNRQIDLISGTF